MKFLGNKNLSSFFNLFFGIPKRIRTLATNLFFSYFYYHNSRAYLMCDLSIGIEKLGKNGIILPHPIGIVIGKYVEIGRSCIIYQNVTIGTKSIEDGKNRKYPRIGNNVYIGASAVIIGDITIGDNVIIGACSFVNKNIPANTIVAGNPAKLLETK
jgi:serine O-acetyltransferase